MAVHDGGMQVSVVYVADCPNWERAGIHLRQALNAVGSGDVEIRFVAVETQAQADETGMHGSPTILVDGQDLFTDAPAHTGLSCRLYSTTQGLVGAPAVADLMEALKRREAVR
jgi:hypothetical protein